MLVFFGTTGDLRRPKHLAAQHGFTTTVVAHAELAKEGHAVDYFTFRITP